MDLKDIQKHIDKMMEEQNNLSNPDFEGYSPSEMHQILYFPFTNDSPLKLQKLSEADYNKIPMLNQVKYLTDLIKKNKEIKLTKKGFLPTKIVSDLFNQGFMKDDFIEKGITKLYKETDSITINLPRILLELAGLTKKRNGKLSLTKSSQKILGDNEELLQLIFSTFTNKFNWAYYDGYEDDRIGQLGYGFSLILLSKYGQEKHRDSFYAEKYFRAFPQLMSTVEPEYNTPEKYASNCYSIRTFDRFLDYFGLINIEEQMIRYDDKKHITKTELFDSLINCTPHKE